MGAQNCKVLRSRCEGGMVPLEKEEPAMTAMTAVTFKVTFNAHTIGGGAAKVGQNVLDIMENLTLVIPTSKVEAMGLVDDRAAMYAAMFGD